MLINNMAKLLVKMQDSESRIKVSEMKKIIGYIADLSNKGFDPIDSLEKLANRRHRARINRIWPEQALERQRLDFREEPQGPSKLPFVMVPKL